MNKPSVFLVSLLLPMPVLGLDRGDQVRLGGELGVQSRGDRGWSLLSAHFEAQGPGSHVALQVPVRWQIANGPGLYERDWDEPGDFARIVRRLALRGTDGRWQVQAGELAGKSLGHGSLVERLHNHADVEHGRLGLAATVRGGAWAGEALADDVLRGEVVGGRLQLRPWAGNTTDGATGPDSLVLGLSLVADRAAPWIPRTDPARSLDEAGFPRAPRLPVVLGALDVALDVWRIRTARVAAYFDLGVMGGNDRVSLGTERVNAGLALGLALRTESTYGDRTLELRGEVRQLHGAWMPGWFDAAYEVERFTVLSGGARSKLAAAVDAARLQRGPWGAALAVDAKVRGWGHFAGQFSWSERDAGSVHLQLVGEERRGVQLRGYLIRKGIQGPANTVALGQALCGASVRYFAVGPVYAQFAAARHWLAEQRDQVALLAAANEFTGTVGVEWRK
jgi:hypothetical protein